jgi:putative ABC transport system substrate-binding protein
MRRRDFVKGLVGSAAWPLGARAQQTERMRRIGIIDNAPIWDNFRQGLRDLGYTEGQNIAIEYRSAEGQPDRLANAAIELARRPVDVIATWGTAATKAAKQATKTIPVVMIGIGDPLRAGLVSSLARPEGNVTGLSIQGPELAPKRLQLLKLAVPTVSRVAFLWNPDNGSHAAYIDEWKKAVQGADVEILLVAVRSSDELDNAFAEMMRKQPDAFTMTADPPHQLHIKWIINFLANNRLPAIFQLRENVIAGGLMSYGPSLPEAFRRAATFVDKILRGSRPADLPVEQPTKFELVLNVKTARGLGLTVSHDFLQVTDELIE